MDQRFLFGYGIYGIYCDDKLVYVGMTMDTFNNRYDNYKKDLENIEKDRKVIEFIRENRKKHYIDMRVLINIPQLNISDNHSLDTRDVELMELALIDLYKPVLNIQGVITKYPLRYSEREKQLLKGELR